MRKGRSVYEQPGTKVDRVASRQKEGFQGSKGEQREVKGASDEYPKIFLTLDSN